MEIKGRQLRRLKELLPEDQRGEFQRIFSGAFNKEDVTHACEVALEKTTGSWGAITIRHNERAIAIIDFRKGEDGFIKKHDDYIFMVHGEGKYFRVYKLRD